MRMQALQNTSREAAEAKDIKEAYLEEMHEWAQITYRD